MLLHIPQILSPAQVAHCRQALAQAEWIDGRATVGDQGAQVKRNRQVAELSPVARELGEIILRALAAHPSFVSAALPLRTVPPLFNYYAGGEHYGTHVDGAVRAVPGTSHFIRTDVSSTLFLCDPDEYEGGELVVQDTYGTHRIKLPAGDLILYPASSLHRVEPVTRGARLCSFFWTQSMVKEDNKRTLLYELDCNLRKLRARHGDSEETVGLAGHYHNLLRLWSEV